MYNMLDTDLDEKISKKDMIKFLTTERFDKKIFPYNFVKAVEICDFMSGHEVAKDYYITFETFKKA